MWHVCDLLYVRVRCFVVRGCSVPRRYINVCNCDMLKFCVVCINGRRYVCCNECNVVSNECNEASPCFVQPIGTHGVEVMYFWGFYFRDELGSLNCDDICICVVNNQFEVLEFVFDYVFVDLQYDKISLTFTAGSVYLCGVCSHVVIFGRSVKLSWLSCGCGGCYDGDACTVVCVACVHAERV